MTSNGPDVTGDAYALALDAGGILRDMEFIQFTPTAFAAPESIRGSTIVGTLLTLPGVAITNANGERFMRRYDPSRMEKTDRATLTRAMTKEILAGRGSTHADVFLDLQSVPSAEMDQHRPGFYRFCRQAGLDPQTQLLETAPSAHTCLGGVVVNSDMRVCEGLYAAGEAVGGVHGTNRLSSNSLTDALVGGWRAGEAAVETCQATNQSDPVVQPPTIPGSGSAGPRALLTWLRHVMGNCAGVVRAGASLTSGLDEMAVIREQVQSMTRQGVSDPRPWLDLHSLTMTADAVLTASLQREESRGSHYREDFPQQDDRVWQGSLYLRRGEDRLHTEFHPVDHAIRSD